MEPPVRVRVVTTCERLGLGRPPVRVRLKVFRTGEQWVMLAWTSSPDLQGLVEWMRPHRPRRVHLPPNPRHRVVRLEFEQPPPPIAAWPEDVTLVEAGLEVDGLSPLTLSGPRDALAAFVKSLGTEATQVLPARPPGKALDGLLTARQLDALRAAVAHGHYNVPRSVGLRELGERLGISSPALSELLRRAERRIIASYISSVAEASGNAPLPSGPPHEQGSAPRRGRLEVPDERLDSLHEELRSTMDEQGSLNEQLQSRNEELEALNAELQTINDELLTASDEVRRRSEEAGRLAALLRGSVEASRAPLVVLDHQLRVVAWGSAAESLLHHAAAEAVGKPLADLLPPTAAPVLRAAVQRATKRLAPAEVRLVQGPVGEVRAALAPSLDGAGNILGWSVALRLSASAERL